MGNFDEQLQIEERLRDMCYLVEDEMAASEFETKLVCVLSDARQAIQQLRERFAEIERVMVRPVYPIMNYSATKPSLPTGSPPVFRDSAKELNLPVGTGISLYDFTPYSAKFPFRPSGTTAEFTPPDIQVTADLGREEVPELGRQGSAISSNFPPEDEDADMAKQNDPYKPKKRKGITWKLNKRYLTDEERDGYLKSEKEGREQLKNVREYDLDPAFKQAEEAIIAEEAAKSEIRPLLYDGQLEEIQSWLPSQEDANEVFSTQIPSGIQVTRYKCMNYEAMTYEELAVEMQILQKELERKKAERAKSTMTGTELDAELLKDDIADQQRQQELQHDNHINVVNRGFPTPEPIEKYDDITKLSETIEAASPSSTEASPLAEEKVGEKAEES